MPNLLKSLTFGAKVCRTLMKGPAAGTKEANRSLSSFFNVVQRTNARGTLSAAIGQFKYGLSAAGRQTSSGAKRAMAAFYDRFSMDTKYGARGTRRTLKFDGVPVGDLIADPAKAVGRVARRTLLDVRHAVTTAKPASHRRSDVSSTAPRSLPEAPPLKELTGPAPMPTEDAGVTGQASVSAPPTIRLTGDQFQLGINGELSPALLQVLNQRRWPTT